MAALTAVAALSPGEVDAVIVFAILAVPAIAAAVAADRIASARRRRRRMRTRP